METFNYMKKKDITEYEKWVSHLNNTKDISNYSIRRIDLLVISISGAGLYIIFETLREFKTGSILIDNKNVLIWSGLTLLFGVMVNFISQITSYFANVNEEKYIYEELKRIEGKKFDECFQSKLDSKVKFYNRLTDFTNITSIVLMFVGLILLSIFNYLLI